MKLTVREAAELLSVSESDLYRWVSAGEIPHSSVNRQPLFSRAELLEWALAHRRPVSVGLFENGDEGVAPVGLAQALRRGGVHHGVRGADRPSALRAVVATLPVDDEQDRELLLQILMAGESMGSTGIGEGIAIPHVRSPMVFPGTPGAVSLCFLETPIAFDAVDGQPVGTIFMLVTPTIRGHLQLLSRLSQALFDPGFRRAILTHGSSDAILAEAARVDAAMAQASVRDEGSTPR